jgi:hypothetical protein
MNSILLFVEAELEWADTPVSAYLTRLVVLLEMKPMLIERRYWQLDDPDSNQKNGDEHRRFSPQPIILDGRLTLS